MNIFKCAIDSTPNPEGKYTNWGYSDIQYAALGNLSVLDFFNFNLPEVQTIQYDFSKDVTVKFPESFSWNNGDNITTFHFFLGLKALLKTKSYITRIIFKYVEGIGFKDGTITFSLKENDEQFFKLFSCPKWIPLHHDNPSLVSGPFVFRKQTGNKYFFDRNPHFFSLTNFNGAILYEIKEPSENIDAFDCKKIDISSDTAFPLKLYKKHFENGSLVVKNTGLYGSIIYGKKLNTPVFQNIRKHIHNILQRIDYSSVTFNVWIRTNNFKQPNLNQIGLSEKFFDTPSYVETMAITSKNTELTVAYDDFYPNKIICELICKSLQRKGIKCQLVRDDYYSPHVDFDLKLYLSPFYMNDEFIRYAAIAGLPFFTANPALKVAYDKIIKNIRFKKNGVTTKNAQLFLDQHAAITPLFFIPSLSLNRYNNILLNPFL